jgi:hypothetical protein
VIIDIEGYTEPISPYGLSRRRDTNSLVVGKISVCFNYLTSPTNGVACDNKLDYIYVYIYIYIYSISSGTYALN